MGSRAQAVTGPEKASCLLCRDVVAASGIHLSDQEFEHIFQHSCLEDQQHGGTLRQACCIHTFMRMRQKVLAEQMQIDCACIHAHHSR